MSNTTDNLEKRMQDFLASVPEDEKEIYTPEVLMEMFAQDDFEKYGDPRLSRRKRVDFARYEIAACRTMREILGTPKLSAKANKNSKKEKITEAEAAFLLLSDLHLGKVVKNEANEEVYNTEIAITRIKNVIDNSLKVIKRVSQGTPIDELCIGLAGDLIDGDGIYQTQHFHIEDSPPFQMKALLKVMIGLIKTVSPLFKKVNIFGVKGNHGNMRYGGAEDANHDIAMYTQLEFFIDELKSSCSALQNVNISYTRLDYINFNVKGWNVHMRHWAPAHGDTYAQQCKFEGWRNSHKSDIICYGHWHHAGMFDINKDLRVFRNGCTSGTDDLAERLSKSNEPNQWLFGVSKERKTTWSYLVDC